MNVFIQTFKRVTTRLNPELLFTKSSVFKRSSASFSSNSFARKGKHFVIPLTALGIGFIGTSSLLANNVEAKRIQEDPEIQPQFKGKLTSHPLNYLADIVELTAPAVVRIEIPVLPFFGHSIGKSAGSGFIVSSDGLIVTNAHVVANQTTCTVTLADGRELPGLVEAVDERTDLATIRINGRNLPYIKLGSSNTCRPGEFIVALGSPLHLSNSITHGIISSVTRRSDEVGLWNNMSYIQTDAAINQGNSGGPLVNLNGEAVGVNSMKLHGAEGIAFAIPSDYVKVFLKKVEEKKKESPYTPRGAKPVAPVIGRRRYIGVTLLTLQPDQLDHIRASISPDLPAGSSGVLVMKVVPGSPAHQSGLKPNDVITTLNGKSVKGVDNVYDTIQSQNNIVFGVKRGAEELKITIQIEEVA